MSFVLSGALNLTNSGPRLKIVEELFLVKLLQRTSGLMHQRRRGSQHGRETARSKRCMWCEHVCHLHATTASGLRNVVLYGQTLHPTTNFALSWQYLILSLNLSDIILVYLSLCLPFCMCLVSVPARSVHPLRRS